MVFWVLIYWQGLTYTGPGPYILVLAYPVLALLTHPGYTLPLHRCYMTANDEVRAGVGYGHGALNRAILLTYSGPAVPGYRLIRPFNRIFIASLARPGQKGSNTGIRKDRVGPDLGYSSPDPVVLI